MNKAKWRDPMVPMAVLALKLCEEAAEVGGEVTDAFFRGDGFPQFERRSIDNMLEELDHTIFIAEIMRDRLVNLGR